MPQTIIAANWKMNKTISEAKEFLIQLKNAELKQDREVIICPPFTALSVLQGTKFKLGGQNMHWEEQGAFTGEISALMLKDLGCEYVIIGHSERRQFFNETDEIINKKLKRSIEHNLRPIFCVGESLEQRQAGQTSKIIERQIECGLKKIDDLSNIIVAYEPIWAIGTGKTATPEQAQEVHNQIRQLTTPETSILYGGSVKPENIVELMQEPDINGALIGGASLDVENFIEIINF